MRKPFLRFVFLRTECHFVQSFSLKTSCPQLSPLRILMSCDKYICHIGDAEFITHIHTLACTRTQTHDVNRKMNVDKMTADKGLKTK